MQEVEKKEDETWRECVARYGKEHGKEEEVMVAFDCHPEVNKYPYVAAYDALSIYGIVE